MNIHVNPALNKDRAVNQCEQQISALNDFVVKFANVNGSGSASANTCLLYTSPSPRDRG